jgi:murein DD-endopeptidase MepM/ murein hydrolase activator NlpD
LDSLETELDRIQQKTKIVENIVQTFLITDSTPETDTEKPDEKELMTRDQLAAYLTIVDSMQKERGASKPIPPEYTPFIWPVRGIITQSFSSTHNGIDIISQPNTLIASSANGIVVKAGWLRDLGNTVEVNHGGYLSTLYGHLNRIHVSLGDYVKRGKAIGTLGNTGNSSGPHLHYSVTYDNLYMDPLTFIRK